MQVRTALGINLSVEESRRPDVCRHVPGMAVDAYIVARGELIGGGLLDEEVRLLHLGEGHRRVVREAADVVSSVVEVIAVAAEGSVVAKVLTILFAGNRLVDCIHRLQDLSSNLLVEAEFALQPDAVDLHIVDSIFSSESRSPRHGLPVHRGQAALPRRPAVLRRPALKVNFSKTLLHTLLTGVHLASLSNLRVQLVVHHPIEAPGSIAGGRRGQTVLLDVDGEDWELGGGELAALLVSRGGEENAEPGLVVDRLARRVSPASVDAVSQHQSSGLGVEHIGGGSVDIAGDDLEGDKVLRTFCLLVLPTASPAALTRDECEQTKTQCRCQAPPHDGLISCRSESSNK